MYKNTNLNKKSWKNLIAKLCSFVTIMIFSTLYPFTLSKAADLCTARPLVNTTFSSATSADFCEMTAAEFTANVAFTIPSGVTMKYVEFNWGANSNSMTVNNNGSLVDTGNRSGMWSNAAANAYFTNSGTISQTTYGVLIQGGANHQVINTGSIGSSTTHGIFINDGAISSGTVTATISNTGSGVISGINGILLQGSRMVVTDILNTGTINGTGGTDVTINQATVTTFRNLQGGNDPVLWSGKLPTNYKIIINGPTTYGKLSGTTTTGTMAFDLDSVNSTAIASGSYSAVISGVSAAKLSATSGASGAWLWSLVETSSGSGTWNLNITAADSTAPTISSAAIASSGTNLLLTANESLDTSSIPTTSSFNLIVDGAVVSSTNLTISANQISLTITQTVSPGQNVTVSYTAPASNPVKDIAGNLLATFSARSVTNNSTQLLPSPLTKVSVIEGLKAQRRITGRASNFAMSSIKNRIDWIRINSESNDRSHQGIKLKFANPSIDRIFATDYNQPSTLFESMVATGESISHGMAPSNLLKEKITTELANQFINNKSLKLIDNPAGNYFRELFSGQWSGWTNGEITIGENTNDPSVKSKIRAKNLAFGIDRSSDIGELKGIVVTVGNDKETVASVGSTLDSKQFSIAGYHSTRMGNELSFNSTLGFTRMEFDTKRLDGPQTLSGIRSGDQLFTEFSIYPSAYNNNTIRINPYGKVNFIYSKLHDYSESGGNFAILYEEEKQRMINVAVGIDATYETYIAGSHFMPSIGFEYGKSRKLSGSSELRYLSESTVYLINSEQATTESIVLRVGVSYRNKMGHIFNIMARKMHHSDNTNMAAILVMYSVPFK